MDSTPCASIIFQLYIFIGKPILFDTYSPAISAVDSDFTVRPWYFMDEFACVISISPFTSILRRVDDYQAQFNPLSPSTLCTI